MKLLSPIYFHIFSIYAYPELSWKHAETGSKSEKTQVSKMKLGKIKKISKIQREQKYLNLCPIGKAIQTQGIIENYHLASLGALVFGVSER